MLQRPSSTAVVAVYISLIHSLLACVPETLPPLMDDHRHRDYTQERNHTIVPAYQFTCHGRVTGWSACVEPGSDRDRYLIHFQVWRSFNGSCYTLVGLNIPPEPLAPSGHCVNFKVPPGDEIVVMPKDVMGFYTDRYRIKGGSRLQNPSRGGVQLDSSSQSLISILSAHQQESRLRVGSQLCRGQNGGRLHLSSSERPVLAAVVDPIQPSTTSCIKHSTTAMARGMEEATQRDPIQQVTTSRIKQSTTRGLEDTTHGNPIELSTTSTIKHSTTAIMTQGIEDTTPSVTLSNSTNIPIPTVHNSFHISSFNQLQMSPSASIEEVIFLETATNGPLPSSTITISAFTTASTPVKTTSSLSSILTDTASTNQPPPPPANSAPIAIQSPVVTSPLGEVGSTAERLPPLLIAGLAIAGLFLTAIVVLVIILVLVCLYDPDKEDKTQKEDSDMEYCEAYELNNASANNQHYQLKEGMVWNSSYSKCVIADSPETREAHSKVPSHLDSDKLSTADRERLGHPFTDRSITISQDSNDYEEVF